MVELRGDWPTREGIGRRGDLRKFDFVWMGICFALAKRGPVELRSSSPEEFHAAFGGFGGKGIRTPGLLIANETLYQLSYTPGNGGNLSIVRSSGQV